jgi:cytochrome c553
MQVSMLIGLSRVAVCTCLLLPSIQAVAGEPPAGKAVAAACAECHEPKDWEGERQASLESLIRDVVQGRVKHTTKVALSDAEIASIAAYWASASR